ncbi:MAG: hypothetical protein CMJ52_02765 [Planctomycetaceae bacterium]|nr:hypothetical protein [Planctomycetaceae bacterium]
MKSASLVTVVLPSLLLGSAAVGQSSAEFIVVEGSTADLTLTLTIETSIGTSSDVDSTTQQVTGFVRANFDPSIPPFLAMEVPELVFDLGEGTVSYDLFCLPIFGCQTLDITVSDFIIQLDAGGVAGVFDGDTVFFPDSPFVSSFNYSVSGDLVNIEGSNVVPDFYSFGTDVLPLKGDEVLMDNLILQPFSFGLDPKDLPIGVNNVTILAEVNLSNTSLIGTLETSETEGDFNGDGCVDGGDLGFLLAAWGDCDGCPEDLNGDGVTDGADLGIFLSLWGC